MTSRLSVINSHLNSYFPPVPHDPSLDSWRAKATQLDKTAMETVYFGRSFDSLRRIRAHFATVPVCSHSGEFARPKNELRRLNIDRLASTFFLNKPNFVTDQEDPEHKLRGPYICSELEQGLVTLSLVQVNLYIDSIQELGTEKHRPSIHRAYSLEEIGCFALTELGHGSDVSSLETRAVYDPATRSFVLNSPTATAAKWWIGGLAKNAVSAVVFASLTVAGEDQGIHGFLIPIRDEAYEPLPGIHIGDCGDKLDLNSVDNGFMLFRDYRCPYDCLLDKFAQVTPEGKYKSSIKKKEKRLGIQLAGLIRGRISVIFGSEANLRTALTIAVRYCAVRKQFADQGKEIALLDYPHHQFRVIPHIGKMMATGLIARYLLNHYNSIREAVRKAPESKEVGEYHAILSAAKAVGSWYSVLALQQLREALGGHGYSSHSSMGRIRNCQDIHTTWEGDNTVLLQQTSKFILKEVQTILKGQKSQAKSLAFLSLEEQAPPKIESAASLRDPQVLFGLLEFRVNYLVQLSIAKLQANSQATSSLTQAWNCTQTFYLQDLSKAYGELMMARSFWEQLPAGSDFTAEAWKNCFLMYVLKIIQEDLGIFLEKAFGAEQAALVKDVLIEVIGQVTQVSVGIFDAIGVEDFLHGSALGKKDGQVYAELIRRVEADPTCYEKAGWVDTLLRIRETGRQLREGPKH